MLLAIATFSFGFTPKSASVEKSVTSKKALGKRWVSGCGYESHGAAHQASINVPISPLEIKGETLITWYHYAGENGMYYCYGFWVTSLV